LPGACANQANGIAIIATTSKTANRATQTDAPERHCFTHMFGAVHRERKAEDAAEKRPRLNLPEHSRDQGGGAGKVVLYPLEQDTG
jgi:hypothetical protein